jgi:hypothetical protein
VRVVLTGVLAAPYTDHDARRYARTCLSSQRSCWNAQRSTSSTVARGRRLLADELRAAR